MKPEIKKRWVEALRSGEYEQGTGRLRWGDRFCCLGVLTDLFIKETERVWMLEEDRDPPIYAFGGSAGYLSPEVMNWAGIKYCNGEYGDGVLAKDNDDGQTFEQIADTIERYF